MIVEIFHSHSVNSHKEELCIILCQYFKNRSPEMYQSIVQFFLSNKIFLDNLTIEQALEKYDNFLEPDYILSFIRTLSPPDMYPSIFRRLKPFDSKTFLSRSPLTLNHVSSFTAHDDSISSIIFDPLSRFFLTSSDDHTIKIWDFKSLHLLKILHGHSNVITSINLSPDNKYIVSTSEDSTIRIWCLHTGECIKLLFGFSNSIVNIATFSPNGKLLACGCEDGLVLVWDFSKFIFSPSSKSTAKNEPPIFRFKERNIESIEWITFSPGSELIAFSCDPNQVLIYSISNHLKFDLISHSSYINYIEFSNRYYSSKYGMCPKVLTFSKDDSSIRVWKLFGTIFHPILIHKIYPIKISSISWSCDGMVAFAAEKFRTVIIDCSEKSSLEIDSQIPSQMEAPILGALPDCHETEYPYLVAAHPTNPALFLLLTENDILSIWDIEHEKPKLIASTNVYDFVSQGNHKESEHRKNRNKSSSNQQTNKLHDNYKHSKKMEDEKNELDVDLEAYQKEPDKESYFLAAEWSPFGNFIILGDENGNLVIYNFSEEELHYCQERFSTQFKSLRDFDFSLSPNSMKDSSISVSNEKALVEKVKEILARNEPEPEVSRGIFFNPTVLHSQMMVGINPGFNMHSFLKNERINDNTSSHHIKNSLQFENEHILNNLNCNKIFYDHSQIQVYKPFQNIVGNSTYDWIYAVKSNYYIPQKGDFVIFVRAACANETSYSGIFNGVEKCFIKDIEIISNSYLLTLQLLSLHNLNTNNLQTTSENQFQVKFSLSEKHDFIMPCSIYVHSINLIRNILENSESEVEYEGESGKKEKGIIKEICSNFNELPCNCIKLKGNKYISPWQLCPLSNYEANPKEMKKLHNSLSIIKSMKSNSEFSSLFADISLNDTNDIYRSSHLKTTNDIQINMGFIESRLENNWYHSSIALLGDLSHISYPNIEKYFVI